MSALENLSCKFTFLISLVALQIMFSLHGYATFSTVSSGITLGSNLSVIGFPADKSTIVKLTGVDSA